MKIAYRIVTPILAVGSIAMGIFLKMFYFEIGSTIEAIDEYMPALSRLGVPTRFSFSIFEIIEMLTGASGEGAEATESVASAFMTVVEPILPHIISLIVFFVLALLVLLAIAVVSAATEKRKAVMGLSISGIVLCFVCMVIGSSAFEKVIGGAVNISDIVGLFSDSTSADALTQLITTIVGAVIRVSNAAFSAGLYSIFGMYILIVLWTVLTNMLIKTPVQIKKKHRRKKPLKSPSALLRR